MTQLNDTKIARWAQTNATSHEERLAPQRDEQMPVLLTPAIALAATQAATTAALVGTRAAGAATAFGYDSGEVSSPKAALDTGRSIRSTLNQHPYSF